MSDLQRRFAEIDDLRTRLRNAESQLKADIRNFSRAKGYSVPLRPEQVRSMISQ